jgi:hypothetical protein
MRKAIGWLALGLVVWACTVEARAAARPPANPDLTAFQAGDSVGLVLRWVNAPSNPANRPAISYDTRIVGTSFGDTLAFGAATTSPDTLFVPSPLPGDTLFVRGVVRSRDDRGGVSAFRSSPDRVFPIPYLPPLPPDSVGIDTIPSVQVSLVDVLPGAWAMHPGDQRQFCAVLTMADGATALGWPVGGWESFEQQAYCEGEYQQWLGRRSG